MTLYEYLEEIENLTFEFFTDKDLDPDKVKDIFSRVESTFYYSIGALEEAKKMIIKLKENGKV